ncbi:unnamed protein product [Mycena citricolor]|uniref:Peptidase M20 dimerisation domain-containing protein n=1 Tax=Mycena citricolor TaxID=2018698 RepID=A0AAD2HZD4_9AGAR|nr:unnamed protein product [Mycena citricolor]
MSVRLVQYRALDSQYVPSCHSPADEWGQYKPSERRSWLRRILLLPLAAGVLSLVLLIAPRPGPLLHPGPTHYAAHAPSVTCPVQPSALIPALAFDPHDTAVYTERLRGAVRVKTETFDGAPTVGSDPWFDKFFKFEAYLRATFPDVFAALKLENFATHGLLFTWKGSDAGLAPIVLMAHQDTVPVPADTVDRWTHPPFDAVLDRDGWIWGRGAGDCKNLLIAELSAISELLKADFKPARTVHVAFGFDEEGGQVRSARAIAAYLEGLYGTGEDKVFLLIDEGGGIMEDYHGKTWITPAMGEKGSTNVQLSVNVPGGHSSIPPAHTAIGILSALISTLEASPPALNLEPGNPFAQFVLCLAKYGTIDPELRDLLADESTWHEAAQWLAERDLGDAARLSTTQAVDIIGGGVKVNALPEEAHVIVNHRVASGDSVRGVQDRYIDLLTPVAEEYDVAVVGFDEEPAANLTRYVKFSAPSGVNASQVTPASGDAWSVFAGTALHLYPDSVVAPYLSTGGTDTRSYVNLTRAIYRFQAVDGSQRYNIHTVDERVHVDGHMNAIRFIHSLIQNADQWR